MSRTLRIGSLFSFSDDNDIISYIWRMNLKKYSVAFILLLCLLGISSQQKAVDANQEIVFQFADDAMRSANAENAISAVKKLLLTVGVQDIQVDEQANGVLKIKYYSDAEVVDVKRLLSEDRALELDFSETRLANSRFPSKEQKDLYNLKVSKIQTQQDLSIGISNEGVLVQKVDVERFINPSDLNAISNRVEFAAILQERITIKFSDTSGFIICDHAYQIPEVRAGPQV